MAQKARRSVPNGSERQKRGKWWWIEWKIDMRTLSVKLKPRLETLNNNNNNNNNNKQINGPEHKMKMWLWTSKRTICSGSEHRMKKVDPNAEQKYSSECKTKQNMALNAEIKINNDSERRYWEVMSLNAERNDGFEHRHWEVITMARKAELRSGDGSERRNWKCDEDGFEHWHWEVIMMAPNAERWCDDDGSERRNWGVQL